MTVHEITMARQDIVRVEMRDGPITKGSIETLGAPDANSQNTWVDYSGVYKTVLGEDKLYLRSADTPPAFYINRAAAVDSAGYGVIGNATVTAAHIVSTPYDDGQYRGETNTFTTKALSMRHHVYLMLDAPLNQGSHTISFPAALGIADAPFVFDDTVTRCCSIRATQVGHRGDDSLKLAYLALKVMGAPNRGYIQFPDPTFHVLDSTGSVVFTGNVVLRKAPEDPEPGSGFAGDLVTYTDPVDGSTYQATPAGTYVYGLDYSSMNMSPGAYRLQIPGIGVSDEITVSASRWEDVAKVYIRGLYHHRSGIELDGRFGYARPASFRAPNKTILKSNLPIIFSSNGPHGNGLGQQAAGTSPWITAEAADWWGGHYDAGDWDRRMWAVSAAFMLLLTSWEHGGRPDVSAGVPKSSGVLGPEYAGTDDLPDVFHEMFWTLDCFRRTQQPDGAIHGGFESVAGPKQLEPSHLERQVHYVYAPDHLSSFTYAALAAQTARILKAEGFSALGQTYEDSAVAAWNFAENIFTDSAARDAYYANVKATMANDAFYDSQIGQIQNVYIKDYRRMAAGAMYALTGNLQYGSVIETDWPYDLWVTRGTGAWEYAMSGHLNIDTTVRDNIKAQFASRANTWSALSEGAVSYRTMKWPGLPPSFGQGGMVWLDSAHQLVRASIITGDPKYLRTLQAGFHHVHGANQTGLCFTTGLGVRNPGGILHEDSEAMGVPAPVGISIYGWSRHNGFFVNNFGSGPVQYVTENTSLTADFEQERLLTPIRGAFPIYEFLIENRWMIEQMEYTVQQTIIPYAAAAIWLNGHDAEPSAPPPPPPPPSSGSCIKSWSAFPNEDGTWTLNISFCAPAPDAFPGGGPLPAIDGVIMSTLPSPPTTSFN